jgi:hypothetical protein
MTRSLAHRSLLIQAVLLAHAAALVGVFTSFYMGAASFAYFLMVLGLRYRRESRLAHRKLMFSAMGIDLSLVLLLEIQRNAIETVAAFDLTAWQFSHVLASTLAVTLYLPMIILGKKLWEREDARIRLWHKRIGITAFVLRSAGFLLMFSLLSRQT